MLSASNSGTRSAGPLPCGAGREHGEFSEGNFPVAVVTAHGLLAVSTLVLALVTVLGPGAR